jgi:periplasmic protein CpxP/Spy
MKALSARKFFFLATGFAIVATIAQVSAFAVADDGKRGAHHEQLAMAGEHHGAHDRHHRGRGHGGDEMNFGGRRLEHALRSVNATPEQKIKVRDIFAKAMSESRAEHGAGRGMRDKWQALLGAPTVDRNAIEAMRADQSAQRDKASKRMSTAFADALEVLSPEQRKQLADRMQQRGQRFERPRSQG